MKVFCKHCKRLTKDRSVCVIPRETAYSKTMMIDSNGYNRANDCTYFSPIWFYKRKYKEQK